MPFDFKTNKAAQMLLVANPQPAFSGISSTIDLLWDAGDLGARDKSTFNYEFNRRVKAKVK